MWGYDVLRCRVCGTPVASDFLFCPECGATIPAGPGPAYKVAYGAPHLVYAPSYPMVPPPPPRPRGFRARRGLLLSLAALVVLWIPMISIVGALLLSLGSTLIYWDRGEFGRPHRSSVVRAYALFWLAAAVYTVVFLAFVSAAYSAWLNGRTLPSIQSATISFVWDSTVATELVVAAVVLQVWNLLPPKLRRQALAAGVALGLLVLLATVLAHLDVAAGLGPELVRMSTVLGVLNRISVARLVEGPGFVWLAFLYYRARGNAVPAPAPAESATPAA